MKKFCIALLVMTVALPAMVQAGGKGLVVYEIWQNMRNTVTGDPTVFQPLYESPNYPFSPNLRYEVASFAGMRDWADHYDVRLYGYLSIPTTGSYYFYICSDDQSQLFLSTEGWPDTKVKVAEVATYCANSPPSWTEFPAQKSAPISLVQGQIVYLEAIMREWEGSDNIYLGWEGPGIALDIIPGLYASTMHPKAASDPIPADGATLVPTSTQLSWTPPVDVNDVATYKVFLGNEPNLVKMIQIADVGTATTANPGTLELGKTYYWRVETTHSNNGKPFTIRGNIWQFTTIPPIPIINPQPHSISVFPGETAEFTIGAQSDSATTFTWFKVGAPDMEVGAGQTLTIPDAQVDAQYYCNVTNDGGTVKSNTVNLRIKRLIAHYQFEGNANDSSPSNLNGALVGDPVFTAGLNQNTGQAMVFDGANDFVDLPDDFSDFSGGITISVWAKPASVANWSRFVDIGNGAASDNILLARNSNTNSLTFEIYIGGTSAGQITAGNALVLNEWQMFVATVDGEGNVALYKNGQRIQTGRTQLPNIITRTSNLIGDSNWTADDFFKGAMDDLALYNYALNPYEIAQLYVDTVPGAAVCPEYPAGDINRDCKADLNDFAELARIWMECGRIPASECGK